MLLIAFHAFIDKSIKAERISDYLHPRGSRESCILPYLAPSALSLLGALFHKAACGMGPGHPGGDPHAPLWHGLDSQPGLRCFTLPGGYLPLTPRLGVPRVLSAHPGVPPCLYLVPSDSRTKASSRHLLKLSSRLLV
jgi:hypothetical protein